MAEAFIEYLLCASYDTPHGMAPLSVRMYTEKKTYPPGFKDGNSETQKCDHHRRVHRQEISEIDSENRSFGKVGSLVGNSSRPTWLLEADM